MMSELHPVGDGGDIRVVFDHLTHLIADLRASDYGHALTHLWPILEELRKAMGPAVYGDDPSRAAALDECKAGLDAINAQAKSGALPADWRAILRDLLLRLLPYLL